DRHRISVLPAQEAVIVFTGGGINTDEIAPFLTKAFRSDRPLAPNPSAAARLRAALATAQRPPASPPPASPPSASPPSAPPPAVLPRTSVSSSASATLLEPARVLSGRTYQLEDNPMGWRSLALTFAGHDAATLTLGTTDATWTAPIGLDGRYRF